MSNLYDILGVTKNASPKEIKQKYRKLALEKHPDKVSPEKRSDADKEFREITNAYSILSDPEKKKKYDIECMTQNFTPEDIFKRFGFGNFFNPPSRQKQQAYVPDKTINVDISFEEMWNGCIKEFEISRNVFCEKCEGKGYESKDTCNPCKGVGQFKSVSKNGYQIIITHKDCELCKGLGYIITKACDICKGEKHKPVNDKIKLSFKSGVNQGDRIYLEGRGDQITKDRFQNVVILVNLLEHSIFKRDGNNLIINYTIDFTETLFGITKNIPHLNGETIVFKCDEIIEPSKTYVMKGLGIKEGDLYIVFNIEYGITKDNLIEYLSNIINKDKILNSTIDEEEKIRIEILKTEYERLTEELNQQNITINELRIKEDELINQVIYIGEQKDKYINDLEIRLNEKPKEVEKIVEVPVEKVIEKVMPDTELQNKLDEMLLLNSNLKDSLYEKNYEVDRYNIKLNLQIEELSHDIAKKQEENEKQNNIIIKLQEKLEKYASITEKLQTRLKVLESENKDNIQQKNELDEYINRLKNLINTNEEEIQRLYQTIESYKPEYTEVLISISMEGIYNGCYKSIYFGDKLECIEFEAGCIEKTIGKTRFIVSPIQHPIFSLDGNDIRMRFDNIPFKQSLYGISKTFKYLDGEDITFNTKEVLDPSKDYKIPNLGINGGDLIINFGIEYPEFTKQQLMKIKCII